MPEYARERDIAFHQLYFRQVINPLVHTISGHKGVKPFVVGIAGGAAAGKTTMAKILSTELIRQTKKSSLACSIDDFHYNAPDRASRGIRWRGAPGAHNFSQLAAAIPQLIIHKLPVLLPQFDKESDNYAPPIIIKTCPDFFIIEGLLVGLRDRNYPQYEEFISRHLNLLIYIDAPKKLLKQWRIETERKLRAKTGRGMSETGLLAYWNEQLGPMLSTHIEPIKRNADRVITVNNNHRYTLQRP